VRTFFQRLGRHVAQHRDALVERGRRALLRRDAELQHQRGEHLRRGVVQLAGDARPLLVLRADHLRGEPPHALAVLGEPVQQRVDRRPTRAMSAVARMLGATAPRGPPPTPRPRVSEVGSGRSATYTERKIHDEASNPSAMPRIGTAPCPSACSGARPSREQRLATIDDQSSLRRAFRAEAPQRPLGQPRGSLDAPARCRERRWRAAARS
jgi:hypothetical protein